MTMQELKIFEEKQIRTVWDEVQEKWYFCIIDIVQILTESKDYLTARKYWNKLKQRLVLEGNETVTNCHQLKLRAADGKLRYSDVADLEQMLRLVQSIPSKKAEPIKRWLAEVGAERIHQMQDPELNSVWGTICTPHQFLSTDGKRHAVTYSTFPQIHNFLY